MRSSLRRVPLPSRGFWWLILLTLAIGLSPRYAMGTVGGGRALDLRAEDLVLLLGFPIWLLRGLFRPDDGFRLPPYGGIFALWLLIGAFGVLVNGVFHDLGMTRAFFFLLKDVEYFLIFAFAYALPSTVPQILLVIKTMIAIATIHTAWIVGQLLLGIQITFWYGLTTFVEPTGPLPSGGMMLLFALLGLNLLLHLRSESRGSRGLRGLRLAAVLAAAAAVGVWTSGSRSSLIGLLFAAGVALILAARMKKSAPILLTALAAATVGFVIVVPTMLQELSSSNLSEQRMFDVGSYGFELDPRQPTSRAAIWFAETESLLEEPTLLFTGYGKGAQLTGESHSQYLHVLKETGILGFLLYFTLMVKLLRANWQNVRTQRAPLAKALNATVFTAGCAMLLIGISNEVLILAKVAGLFWLLAGLALKAADLTPASAPSRLPSRPTAGWSGGLLPGVSGHVPARYRGNVG